MSALNTRVILASILMLGLASLIAACSTKQEKVVGAPAPNTPQAETRAEDVFVTAAKQSAYGTMATLESQNPAYSSPPNYAPAPVPGTHDRSEYPEYVANSIKLTSEDPVSTFSVDVDTSSYGVMRALIKSGELPNSQIIRTEELLNYFDYDYPLPQAKEQPFATSVSVFDAPWSKDKQLVRIGIKGYNIEPSEQPDSNLVFLLDVSGSMNQENKLPLVKKSFALLLKSLKPTDTISMVVYAGASGVVLPPTKVKSKTKILAALNRLSAGGSTAGGAGLALAYQLAHENFKEQGVNRIILATDGDFNVGQSSNEALQQMVEQNRDAGIYLSVLGFGRYNYQDDMMQTIAQNGNGIAAYIDTLQEAKKVLVDEATSNLFPIANDVKIQVEFNPKNVAEYRLIGYETRTLAREDFNNDKVDAGEIGSGHTVTAMYEITPTSAAVKSIDPLRYSNEEQESERDGSAHSNELGFVKLRYKLPGESASRLMSQPITIGQEADKEALFAASVIAFAESLRGGKHLAEFCMSDIVELAQNNKGTDASGYRAEFIQLVEMARLLRDSNGVGALPDHCKG